MDSYKTLKCHAESLRRQLDEHQKLLEQAEDEGNGKLNFCPHFQCPHEEQLRQAIQDVVDTLEETRKAFKSKQLERLRRRMLDVLCSTDNPQNRRDEKVYKKQFDTEKNDSML